MENQETIRLLIDLYVPIIGKLSVGKHKIELDPDPDGSNEKITSGEIRVFKEKNRIRVYYYYDHPYDLGPHFEEADTFTLTQRIGDLLFPDGWEDRHRDPRLTYHDSLRHIAKVVADLDIEMT